jgi:hypothetical protein
VNTLEIDPQRNSGLNQAVLDRISHNTCDACDANFPLYGLDMELHCLLGYAQLGRNFFRVEVFRNVSHNLNLPIRESNLEQGPLSFLGGPWESTGRRGGLREPRKRGCGIDP